MNGAAMAFGAVIAATAGAVMQSIALLVVVLKLADRVRIVGPVKQQQPDAVAQAAPVQEIAARRTA